MQKQTVRNVSISLLLSGLFLYLAFRTVPLAELGAAFQRFDVRWLVPAVAISLVLQVLRAWRWQLELRPLSHIGLGQVWLVTCIAYMAINVLPARLGEVVRPWLLSRRTAISFANVVGNLVVEKTMDSLVILFYILLGLLSAANLPAWVRRGALFPAAGAAVLVVLVLVLYFSGEAFFARRVVRYLPARAGTRLLRVVRAVVDGMRILPDRGLLAGVLAVSIALWFMPILSSYVLIHAFGFALPFSAALIVFIFIGFGTALPQAPGMIGTYQYACILALGLFGVPRADALAYGLVLNGIQLTTLVAQGVVALAIARVGLEDLRPARPGG
ncbi:MAG: flippase-like domain-containing protein [Deltaproteobacteria bacterium]|nr:flippase-like domain-containing protein [Deltaproteobacteria bacterium]